MDQDKIILMSKAVLDIFKNRLLQKGLYNEKNIEKAKHKFIEAQSINNTLEFCLAYTFHCISKKSKSFDILDKDLNYIIDSECMTYAKNQISIYEEKQLIFDLLLPSDLYIDSKYNKRNIFEF